MFNYQASHRLKLQSLLAVVMVACSVTAPKAEETVSGLKPDGRTAIESTPWTPPTGPQPKVIYGTDDRIDVYQETDPEILGLAESVCGLMSASRLVNNGNGTYNLQTSSWTVGGNPACSGEPFASQPVAMFCTGFLVGDDLIATAGHCYDDSDISATAFVFGFEMANATTPVVTVDEDQVYFGVEIVGRELGNSDNDDFCIIRVDRTVVAPGAFPLPIRRSGVIGVGEPVGVIGHPSGLPKKIAYGATTAVYGNTALAYFVANLDTYGGNSGSPVFNQNTGIVEGILVRGAQDYVISGNCFVSNVLANSAAGTTEGEDVSKSTRFALYIPDIGNGVIRFDASAYTCGSTATITLRDLNAPGTSLNVTVTTTAGDSEIVAVDDGDDDNIYVGTITLSASGAAVSVGDNVLQGLDDDTITVEYQDADDGSGNPAILTATAARDCSPPSLSNYQLIGKTPETFSVSFESNEPATPTLEVGTDCIGFPLSSGGDGETMHEVTATGLSEGTEYQFRIRLEDQAGNTAVVLDAGSTCFAARTAFWGIDRLYDPFEPAAVPGWLVSRPQGTDTWGVVTDARANTTPQVYSLPVAASGVQDIRLISPPFSSAKLLEFHHTYGFESGYDGATIEISIDNMASWIPLESYIIEGGYNGLLSNSFGNPLGGAYAWTGGSLGSMSRVVVDISSFNAGSVRVAFRYTSDTSIASNGWLIDTVRVRSYNDTPPMSAGDAWILLN